MATEVNFSSANDGMLAGTEQVVAVCQGLLSPPCCPAVERPSPLPLGTAGADKHIRDHLNPQHLPCGRRTLSRAHDIMPSSLLPGFEETLSQRVSAHDRGAGDGRGRQPVLSPCPPECDRGSSWGRHPVFSWCPSECDGQ